MATYTRRPTQLAWFDCGIHGIKYEGVMAGCPLCEMEREVKQLRSAVQDLHGRLELAVDENSRLKVQVDIVVAIREAAATLNDEDLTFFKTVLYQWRDEKSLALKTTHGSRKKGQGAPTANGFIVMPRKGDPWGYACSSIGGLAIAAYFDEATNSSGPSAAMNWLVRGLADHLPGATT